MQTLEASPTRDRSQRGGPTMKLLELRAPTTFQGPWSEADAAARVANEPLLVPISTYTDDRGWSLMNLMAGALQEKGQINFSLQYPGVVKAWHRHERQTDFWICVQGHVKSGIFREPDGVGWLTITGERRPGVIVIPPGLWHGVTPVGPTPAGLLYYVTEQYDAADPDEQRCPHDGVQGFPWEVRHG